MRRFVSVFKNVFPVLFLDVVCYTFYFDLKSGSPSSSLFSALAFHWLWETKRSSHIFTFALSCLWRHGLWVYGNRCVPPSPLSLSLSCFPLLRSLAESYSWRKGTSKKMFVQKNRRVKVPWLKAEFTRNEDMCNNFQIVLMDTILFYWLETVFSKRDRAREIRGDKKLKQCIDGSFLTAKNEKAVPSQGK